MQRVLSFQMARGFSESSEFVTKRMCFSFLFSVGFLCLICGFLLGRFIAHRSIEYHAEKKRLEVAGNGLDNTEHIQHLLLQQLEEIQSFTEDSRIFPEISSKPGNEILQINDLLSNLSLFHRVTINDSCIVAISQGSREPDRYVVLSANGNGINIVVKFAIALNQIHNEQDWKSRRTLVFCTCFDTTDHCPQILPSFIQQKVIAYLALHDIFLQGKDYFVVSGSDIIQSIALDSIREIYNLRSYNFHSILEDQKLAYHETVPPRLPLDMPQVIFSCVNDKNISITRSQHDKGIKFPPILLTQIVSQTVWRLSESLTLQWNSRYLNDAIIKILKSITISEVWQTKEQIKESLSKIISGTEILYKRLDGIESNKLLYIRILNDLLMDLDKVLLCPDKNSQSMADLIIHSSMCCTSTQTISVVLDNILKCYGTAMQILQKW